MADSIPLLSHWDNPAEPIPPPRSLNETIERCIQDSGWFQIFQAILVSLAWFFDSQQIFISVFTDAEPSWHCTDDSVCNNFSNVCQIPKNSWSWDWPPHASIISEWSLECSTSFITGFPASSFFIGCLVGGLGLATLADSTLGRKNMLLFSCLMMSLSSIVTVFSPNIWIYSALRFLNGFGRATVGTCALVLSTELVGKRWRGQAGVIGFFCFTLGFLSLPVMAYVNRGSSWRILYLWISVPTIVYCILVHFFVHESPRWLFVKGRKEEAVTTLKSMAQCDLTMSFSNVLIEQESGNENIYSSIWILMNKRWAARRLSALMVTAFGIGMVYYGMPLALGNLSVNLYIGVTLNALFELPASLITFFLIGKINRKDSLLGFTILSGICSVLCVVMGRIWPSLQIAMELISFFNTCGAFNMSMIYTLELFPTSVRNSALSMVRQALVLGGAFSPMLVAAGRKNNLISFGVFGIAIGFCGLPLIGLPETSGGTICDTMDEEEHKQNEKPAVAIPSLA
ncbi:hypothetical protein V6N13_067084 [Hibiscus sabdariffa]|uniref:Major facilitator superfamily (MFS) profile domain-containing protein n=1 Tax=Hibiscus sabdariffa TaxID=183260 RepID=A0ABR2DTT3_9ROSI